MTQDDIRQETCRRLAEIDPELALDEQEVERQMPDVHRRMIEEAEIAERHYDRISHEAITPRYRDMYKAHSQRSKAQGDQLRAMIKS